VPMSVTDFANDVLGDRASRFHLIFVAGLNAPLLASAFLKAPRNRLLLSPSVPLFSVFSDARVRWRGGCMQAGAAHVVVCGLASPAVSRAASLFQQTFYGVLLASDLTIQRAFEQAKAVVMEEVRMPRVLEWVREPPLMTGVFVRGSSA
jgi:hypothetical protein